MKVHELITLLQQVDQELEAEVEGCDCYQIAHGVVEWKGKVLIESQGYDGFIRNGAIKHILPQS